MPASLKQTQRTARLTEGADFGRRNTVFSYRDGRDSFWVVTPELGRSVLVTALKAQTFVQLYRHEALTARGHGRVRLAQAELKLGFWIGVRAVIRSYDRTH